MIERSAAGPPLVVRAPRPRYGIAAIGSAVFGHRVGSAGAALVLLFALLAAAAPLIAPYSPVSQPAARLLPPGAAHLLGTDEFGRDVLSRIIYGARVSFQVGVVSVAIALVFGGTLGLMSGYYFGAFDAVAMRVIDVMFAFPTVILIIAIAGVLGPSIGTAMIAIGIVYAPIFARVVRGPTLAVMRQQHVEGARAVGAGRWRIMLRYVVPNIAVAVIVQASLSFSTAILSEATLSFLGLGVQPPYPSWGTMLSAGRQYMELAPWLVVYPGLAIALAVLGVNLLGDALRDVLDPRLRGGAL